MNAAVDHPQGIDPDRRSGRLAFNAAVANIERGAVPGANQSIRAQASSFELRHRVRAFIFDGEELAPGMTDENVVIRHLEGPAAPIGNVCGIDQISKIAVIQAFFPAAVSVWLS